MRPNLHTEAESLAFGGWKPSIGRPICPFEPRKRTLKFESATAFRHPTILLTFFMARLGSLPGRRPPAEMFVQTKLRQEFLRFA